jgi:HEPN domain-containing protein
MPPPSDGLIIANLLRIAREDLAGARQLATTGNRNAAYLCQQAAEKVARAIAHPEGGHLGREHRIDVIVEFLPEANPLKPLLRSLEELTPYATTFRYPRSAGRISEPPGPERMALLLERTAMALELAARVFGVDLDSPDTVPAADVSPLREATRAPAPISSRRN